MIKTSKYLLVVKVLLFIPGLLQAQTTVQEVDSVNYYFEKSNLPFDVKYDKILKYIDKVDYAPNKSLAILQKLLKMASEKKDSLRITESYINIGKSYANKENYFVALEYYFKAKPYVDSHSDTSLILDLNNSMGIAYSQRKQHKKASAFFLRNIAINKARKSASGEAVSCNNVAIEYIELKEFQKAEKYLRICYNIFNSNKAYPYLSTVVMNLGVVRFEKGQYDSALYYYRRARDLDKKYHTPIISDNTSNNLGQTFYKLRQYDSALYYLNYTLAHIDTLNAKYTAKETYHRLSEVYHALGDNKKAYYYLNKYQKLIALIFDDESVKKTAEDEANFNYLKIEGQLKLSEQKRALEQQQQEVEAKKNRLIYMLVAVVGLLLIMALIIVFKRSREKTKANIALTHQKNQIQHQQQEITDSINYAKRIQESILPSHEVLQKHLGEHVLFYQPKDIVGGDFYFVENVHGKKYFAVIDCTGHGVPGGFMSMLGYNAIQNALLDLKIEQPAKILDCLSKNLVTHFTQEGRQTLRDGMDMAFCCLYEKEGKHILEFAGAHNPCWIVKQQTNEVIEIKANKQPIGYFENYKPFTNHVVELQKGDMIYLFTDGYADQFGGPNGKKFKYSQLKSILQKQVSSAIEKQSIMANTFNQWKGNLEQIDDVCVVGIKV